MQTGPTPRPEVLNDAAQHLLDVQALEVLKRFAELLRKRTQSTWTPLVMNLTDLPQQCATIPSALVDHFGIVVRDIGAAIAFYRDVLGCSVTAPVERAGQGLTKAYVQFGNMCLELIMPTTPDSPIKHILEQHNVSDFLVRQPSGGIHHVCYAVPDLPATHDLLVQHGYRVLGTSGPVTGASGDLVCFLNPEKLDGVLIELKQA